MIERREAWQLLQSDEPPVFVHRVPTGPEFTHRLTGDQDLTGTLFDPVGAKHGVLIQLTAHTPELWTVPEAELPFRFIRPAGGSRTGHEFLFLSPAFCRQWLRLEAAPTGELQMTPVGFWLHHLVKAVFLPREFRGSQGRKLRTDWETHVQGILRALAELRSGLLPHETRGSEGFLVDVAQTIAGHEHPVRGHVRRQNGARFILQTCAAVEEGTLWLHPATFHRAWPNLWEQRRELRAQRKVLPLDSFQENLAGDLDRTFWSDFPVQALISPETARALQGDEDGDVVFARFITWQGEPLIFLITGPKPGRDCSSREFCHENAPA